MLCLAKASNIPLRLILPLCRKLSFSFFFFPFFIFARLKPGSQSHPFYTPRFKASGCRGWAKENGVSEKIFTQHPESKSPSSWTSQQTVPHKRDMGSLPPISRCTLTHLRKSYPKLLQKERDIEEDRRMTGHAEPCAGREPHPTPARHSRLER